jgi:hypothetical protein
MHFPPHRAREGDPHYAVFDHYHRKTRATAPCWVGGRIGFADCLNAQGSHAALGPLVTEAEEILADLSKLKHPAYNCMTERVRPFGGRTALFRLPERLT